MAVAKIKKITVFFLALILLSSCQKVDIEKIKNVRIGSGGIAIDMEIKNPYPLTIKLSQIHMDLTVDQFRFKDVIYNPEIVLKPHSDLTYSVIVDIKPFKNLRSSTGAFMAMVSQDSTRLIIDGDVMAKILFFRKRVPFYKELYFKYNKK